jgi:hypothetical protein
LILTLLAQLQITISSFHCKIGLAPIITISSLQPIASGIFTKQVLMNPIQLPLHKLPRAALFRCGPGAARQSLVSPEKISNHSQDYMNTVALLLFHKGGSGIRIKKETGIAWVEYKFVSLRSRK